MSIEIRPVAVDELRKFHQAMAVPYGFDPTPELWERFQKTFELDRLRTAVDGDQMVATFGTFSFRMTVPGNTLPTGGTTIVSVLPTHRRQGVLRALMTEHLAEVHAHGEPLAALWASESSIYGRFGYGPASERALMKLDKQYARMQQPASIRGAMRLVERDEALKAFPEIYEQVSLRRPGMYRRTGHWWEHRALADPEYQRRGATALRRVLHVRDGQAVGYVLYRTRINHSEETAALQVVELIAVDAEAEKALWQYLFGTDLISSITFWNQPVDDPLLWWLEQPRRMERKVEDALWVRPVDVAAALAGRRYSTDGSVTLRMRDEVCPWNDGVYRLEVERDGTAHCEPDTGESEIDLTPYALGAVYLGGHRFSELARSGIITGNAEALLRADAMFRWDPLPWCQEVF